MMFLLEVNKLSFLASRQPWPKLRRTLPSFRFFSLTLNCLRRIPQLLPARPGPRLASSSPRATRADLPAPGPTLRLRPAAPTPSQKGAPQIGSYAVLTPARWLSGIRAAFDRWRGVGILTLTTTRGGAGQRRGRE